MAKMYPDNKSTRVIFGSNAEEQVYTTLQRDLGDLWRVYHSVTLSQLEQGEGMKDGEIDFVCYHPQFGVLVIEVKGGRIGFRPETNTFYSVNRHGQEFQIANPFQQSLVWKSRFLRYLKRSNIKVPVTHAVCFPGVGEDEIPASAGVETKLIIGRNKLKNIEDSLKDIVRLAQPEKFLNFEDRAQELERILVGSSFTSKLYLRDYIAGHENRMKDVEFVQETLITPITGAVRLGIEGEAGTGKTMLAIHLAKHFRDLGKEVLMLSSNTLLNLFMKREVGSGVDISTYDEIAGRFGVDLQNSPADYAGSKDDWIQFEGPDRLKKAVAASTARFDVILCDEAQDVQPFWWDGIESLLRDPNAEAENASRFYLFFDRSQGVFGSGGGERQFVAEDTLPVKAPYFPLVHNYRNTREIASFARGFRTGHQILQSHSARLGYVPEIIPYTDAEDCRRLLARLTKKLIREEGLAADEMTILSARALDAKESVLAGVEELGSDLPLHRMTHEKKRAWRDAKSPAGAIPVSTVASFKGLETSVGILVNFSEYNLNLRNAIMSSLAYVACTRAKHMLYIFVQKDDPKRQVFEQALKAIKSTGSMVLDGASAADYEFVGKVAHYNPDRVGWLSVDDPAFQKGQIMFFPADVAKSGLSEMKVGMKVKFRARVEGYATIAGDLRPAS